jgi:hypothetical protein
MSKNSRSSNKPAIQKAGTTETGCMTASDLQGILNLNIGNPDAAIIVTLKRDSFGGAKKLVLKFMLDSTPKGLEKMILERSGIA